jgi:hypothetical protein
MKKGYYFVLALFLLVCQGYAQIVNRIDAEIVAKNFIEQNALMEKTKNIIIDTSIVRSYNGNISYYVVCLEDQGYVIISAYDGYGPILMFTDSGRFNELDLSPSFEWWMSLYSARINELMNMGIKENNSILLWDKYRTSSFASEIATRNSVAPLLTVTWDQGTPYNSLVKDGGKGANCSGGKCAVGCVAVAGGQVLHYWGYPLLDYDWCNMPNSLMTSSKQTEINAVAKLLADVGEKAGMTYCQNNGCNSGAVTSNLRNVFAQYGYSYGDYSHFASTNQLEEKIKSELNAGRPLITRGSGHAFVVDGYIGGMFHINWGWGGSQNGYYYINSHSYTDGQAAIFGIAPNNIFYCNTYCDAGQSITLQPTLIQTYLLNPPIFGTFKTAGVSYPANYRTIENGKNAVYKVYKECSLEPGFTVEHGGTLTIEIERCPAECSYPNK